MSGKLRFVEKCFSSVRDNILEFNDCDVYMQTYSDSNGLETAINLYKPKTVLVESEESVARDMKPAYPNCYDRMQTVPFQWRNLKTVFSMLKSGDYDCVIRSRYDIKFSHPLKLNEFDINNMNIPMGADYLGGIFDMFAFSSFENMRWYMSIFDHMDSYHDTIGCHPETMMRHHLTSSPTKFTINRFDYPVFVARGGDHPFSGGFEFFNNHRNLPFENE